MELLEVPPTFEALGNERIFNGEEAFVVLLRLLPWRDTGVHLATIFDQTQSGLSEMYNKALSCVYGFKAACVRLELWEEEF